MAITIEEQAEVLALIINAIKAQIPALRDYLNQFSGIAIAKAPDDKNLGSPSVPTIYEGGAGTYTTPTGTITTTANLTRFYWDGDGPWLYLEVPVNANLTNYYDKAAALAKADLLSPNGKNLYNKDADIKNTGIDFNTGQLVSVQNIDVSQPIKVTPGQAYTLSGRVDSDASHAVTAARYLNADLTLNTTYKPFGSAYGSGVNQVNGTFTPPTGVAYFQFTSRAFSSNNNLVQLEAGSTATAYEAYGPLGIYSIVSRSLVASGLRRPDGFVLPASLIKQKQSYTADQANMPALGDGSEANPWVSLDGSAGIATGQATLSRGGHVEIPVGRSNISTFIPILANVTYDGKTWNYPNDPNGVAESFKGCKLFLTNYQSYVFGAIYLGVFGGVTFRNIGFRSGKVETTQSSVGGSIYNPNFDPANPHYNSGIAIDNCRFDQMLMDRLSFNNFSVGIFIGVGGTNKSTEIDATTFQGINTDGCAIGILFQARTFYATWLNNIIADCAGPGLIIDNLTQAEHGTISYNKFVRNAGIIGASAWGFPMASLVVRAKHGFTITENKFEDNGKSTVGDRAVVETPANDIYLQCDNCIVKNNEMLKSRGVSVVVKGNFNDLDNRIYNGYVSAYTIEGSWNKVAGVITGMVSGGVDIISGTGNVVDAVFQNNGTFDVRIAAGCKDTVVYSRPGMTIVDQGTNTIIK